MFLWGIALPTLCGEPHDSSTFLFLPSFQAMLLKGWRRISQIDKKALESCGSTDKVNGNDVKG